ncbi:MAG: hypothetical protein V7731_02390 [Amphritea sp.]
MDLAQSHSDTDNNQRSRLVIIVACTLLIGLLLSGLYLSLVADRLAKQQVAAQGQQLSQQVVTLIKPALLAADPVSLNFLLNELVKQDSIDAIILNDSKDRLLARAGESTRDDAVIQEIIISQQEQPLAFLQLIMNSAPHLQHLQELLIQGLILSLMVLILTLSTLWFCLRPSDDTATESDRKYFKKLKPFKKLDGIDFTDTDSDRVFSNKSNSDKPAPAFENADALVDLLRPADNAPEMPDFAPFSEDTSAPQQEQLKAAPDQSPIIEEISLTTISPAAKKTKNPLFDNEKREIQLDLYAFEQELELIVSAENAGYLLYLDLTSGHSENIKPEELQEMQEYYYRMLEMVTGIYQGEAARINNGNLQLAFLKPHKDDSHGVNAVCASQLFNRLYKLFNQQRIRQLQPVLNLHMALVRGHYKKLPRLQEEVRYLTRTTESNELITHTALSEAPDLKVSLLAGAEIKRAEEDKVLILSVNENYQKLLDKQAQHLLKKLLH